MNKTAGWHIWIDDGGRVRMFTVCNSDREEAEDLALRCVTGGTTISSQEITQELISKLCMQPDRVVEWGSLGLREPLRTDGTTKSKTDNA